MPIENSLEGSVNATLDALAMETEDVDDRRRGRPPDPPLPDRADPLELAEIETVVSHPQANAQCARFIRTRLPRRAVLAGSSTADAVRMVAEHDGPWAALGNRLAAERYGCLVLRAGVEDVRRQRDPLRVAGPRGQRPGGRACWPRQRAAGAVEDRDRVLGRRLRGARAGWSRCLSEFAERGVNLTRIESRPAQAGPRAATCSSSTSRATRTSRRRRRPGGAARPRRGLRCSAPIRPP